jgi:hypothetical protein
MDSIERRTALGVRCWDPVFDRPVIDGLRLTLAPYAGPGRRIAGRRTPSGVFAFHDLPGLHDWDLGDLPLTDSPLSQRRFALSVDDTHGRFLPMATSVYLPWAGESLFLSSLIRRPSPGGPPGFYLFSAPARNARADLAALRACLVERASGQPAAWAVLEVEVPDDARVWYAVADARGCTTLIFPYPQTRHRGAVSPVASPVVEQEWDLEVCLRYGGGVLPAVPGTGLPEQGAVLSQPQAVLFASESLPAASALSVGLSVGPALVLRTDELPWLLVGTAPTSP